MPIFERSIEIDAPIQSVYDFHLDTRNAARIASEGQEFVSITGDFPLQLNGEVELKVKMKTLPGTQTWVVRVTELAEPILVVDEMLKGPFAKFRHEHRFAPTDNGGTRFNTAQVGIRALWMVDVMVRYPTAFVVSVNLS